MVSFPTPPTNTRLGFHYYPDTLHYRDSDLKTWLPELKALGVSWLTLLAPAERAIPEFFLNGLIAAGIEPILHMPLPLENQPQIDSLRLLFNYYARRGVHYLTLFDRPNLRAAWPSSTWAQTDLVERFLDLFIPLAEAIQAEGLTPVFPPLEPGGDYWDLAFLRSALRGMKRRGRLQLLESMAVGAYAWGGNRSLDWGAGGPERWPGARPYFTAPGVQDQRGFRIFDWYLTILRAELDTPLPLLLLRAGVLPGDAQDPALPMIDEVEHVHRNLSIVRLLCGDTVEDVLPSPALPGQTAASIRNLEPIPAEVLACNFWLLSAASNSSHFQAAWFKPDGHMLPAVSALRQWAASRFGVTASSGSPIPPPPPIRPPLAPPPPPTAPTSGRPIAHYLLLPLYAWGAADWDLDRIRSFVTQFHPTIGFSPEEARLAAKVTILAEPQSISEEVLVSLQQSGCLIERIGQDGTLLAPSSKGDHAT